MDKNRNGKVGLLVFWSSGLLFCWSYRNMERKVFEARQDTWCHKKGDKFEYPKDMAQICPWLLSSMHDFIRLQQNDATLTWTYEGTPYEKIINKDGITTEFVRCPDPTANLVAKITRTEIKA